MPDLQAQASGAPGGDQKRSRSPPEAYPHAARIRIARAGRARGPGPVAIWSRPDRDRPRRHSQSGRTADADAATRRKLKRGGELSRPRGLSEVTELAPR